MNILPSRVIALSTDAIRVWNTLTDKLEFEITVGYTYDIILIMLKYDITIPLRNDVTAVAMLPNNQIVMAFQNGDIGIQTTISMN